MGPFDGDPDAFQRFRGGLRVRLLGRRATARPSRESPRLPERLPRRTCRRLGSSKGTSHGATERRATTPPLPDRDEARAGLGVDGPMLAFAGRVTRQKSLGVALDALARVDDVSLFIAGDGPDLAEVRRRVLELGLDGRVRFLGSLGRNDVLTLFGCRRVASRRRGRTSRTRSSRRSPSGRR